MDVFLHIGSGKTGTSSVQHFLGANRATLASLGYLYPETPGKARHQDLGFFIAPDRSLENFPNWHRWHGDEAPAEFREAFRERLLGEIAAAGLPNVVLSDEALYGLPGSSVERLRGLLEELGARAHVLVYLRRQDDHLISRYQQVVKTGETRTLEEWAAQDMTTAYDYAARLGTWAEVLRPASLVVRPFERSSFVDGSLYQDFLAAVGVDRPASEFAPVERRNESLDAAAVELVRLLNQQRRDRNGPQARIDNRRLVKILATRPAGPTLTLPEPVLDDFMEKWAESNRLVATTWLGRADGQLFHEPRKTQHTTTLQGLDPDAGARLLGELELPAPLLRRARLALGLQPDPPPRRGRSRVVAGLRRLRNRVRGA